MTKPTGRPNGRPSIYSDELVEEICDRIANGESVRTICLDEHMPGRRTIDDWLDTKPAFRAKCARAREAQADYMADKIMIESYKADVETVQVYKLRVDTLKWLAARLSPRKWGDKVTFAGDEENPLKVETIKRVMIDDNARD